MLLRTERLTIRPIAADDWRSIKDIWVDFNASEYAQYDMPLTRICWALLSAQQDDDLCGE